MKISVALVVSAALLAGCSNPKEASKSNFQHAINDWIEKAPPCLAMPDGTITAANQKHDAMPVYVEAAVATRPYAEEDRQRHIPPLNALVDAGLLRSAHTEIEQGQRMFGSTIGKVAVLAYDLTEKGKAAFKDEADKSGFGGMQPRFCYGKPQVDEVTNFTQPADMMGMTLSQVSYTYHLADLPDWAKNAKVQAAFPALATNTAGTRDAKAAVVLTNDGWKHEKAI